MPQPLARDTTLTAEAVQIAWFRQRSPHERLALLFEHTAFTLASSRASIARAHPHLSPLEQARFLAALQFGETYAARVQHAPTIEGTMAIPTAIAPVAQAFNSLHIPYFIGGSIASSAYSMPRSTYDVDMVAAMQPQHVAPFVTMLQAAYYVQRAAVLDSPTQQSSFTMTHQATGINIDIFVPQERPYDAMQFSRAQLHTLPGASEPVNLASPEDVVLNKLAWYVLGNEVSDQQWRDVQALLRVQGSALDVDYMRHWAAELALHDLLDYALRGERPPRPDDAPPQQRLF